MGGLQKQQGRGLLQHGCKHYRRRCKLVAPCCGEVFWCRHCHNEVKAANEWVSLRRRRLMPLLVSVEVSRTLTATSLWGLKAPAASLPKPAH